MSKRQVKMNDAALNGDIDMVRDPFDNPVFASARARQEAALRQLATKVVRAEQSLYTCHKCGSKDIQSVSKQVRSCDEGTSVFNTCFGCKNKWRDG